MQSNILLELTISQATAIAILVPLVSVTLTASLYLIANRNPSNRLGRVASILTRPIPLKSLHPERAGSSSVDDVRTYLRKQLVNRYFLIILLLVLFLVSNLLATFYHIMCDYTINIIDPEFVSSTWENLIIESPFKGGWYGSLPWYGDRFLPPEGAIVYHETWNWIYFSAGITDDLTFFIGATNIVLIMTVLFGLVFLLPLIIKPIRNSFSQSLFFFLSGMLVSTRGIFGYFCQAWKLEYESSYLQYGIRLVTSGQLQVTTEAAIISNLFPILVILCAIFVVVGGLLWKKHYPDHRRSYLLFMGYTATSYWASFFLIMNT